MRLPCLCCHSVEFKNIGEKNNFKIDICKKCKTLSADNNSQIENNFDYNDYYSEDAENIPDFVFERLIEIVQEFSKYRQSGRLLDVGCGAGTILKAALDDNWQAEGVEVSASSIKFLRKNNFKVFHGEIMEAAFPENHFDVIVASEIIEHIPEPQKLLDESYRTLRSGGLFWGTTPHGQGLSGKFLGSDWSCVLPPEHLHLLSVKGLHIMLEKAGFRQIEVKTHSINPYEIIEGLKKLLKSKDKSVNTSEEAFDYVKTSYELNETMINSPLRKNIKKLINAVLNITSLGDSLKIKAVK